MTQRPAPTDILSADERQRCIDALPKSARRAIALTLDDLDGWGTLHGALIRFDTQTGTELPQPIKTVDEYDRTPRSGLPADWIDLFIRLGWLELVHLGNGWTVWKPTDQGVDVRNRWLPEHLRGRR
jgi:hypothetical protein